VLPLLTKGALTHVVIQQIPTGPSVETRPGATGVYILRAKPTCKKGIRHFIPQLYASYGFNMYLTREFHDKEIPIYSTGMAGDKIPDSGNWPVKGL